MKKVAHLLFTIAIAISVTGCALSANRQAGPTPMGGTPGMVGPQGMPTGGADMGSRLGSDGFAGTASSNSSMLFQSQAMSELTSMRERVRRVERAMIRLDRRMQLLERNELARISSLSMSGEETAQASNMFKPMSMVEPAAGPVASTQGVESPFSRGAVMARPEFQPVAVTSSLQAGAPQGYAQQAAPQQAPVNHLPSLADKNVGEGVEDKSVAIWTIDYQENKIWPAREQLTASYDVVEALRAGEPVALFARGLRPASREFRERVRAISKYLGKVANLENVPIASMPAEHLAGDTIEIITAR